MNKQLIENKVLCIVTMLVMLTGAAVTNYGATNMVDKNKSVSYPIIKKGKETVEIIKNGKPNATIVLPEKHSYLNKSVRELNDYLFKISGCHLPVKTEKDKITGNMVLLGESKYTQELKLKEEYLPDEGFIIRTYPGKLVVLGDRERMLDGWFKQKTNGTLWAVYEFLEQLGVRWYYPDELWTYVPKMKTVSVNLDIEDAPVFHTRDFLTSPWRKNKLKYRAVNAEGEKRTVHSTGYWAEVYHATHPEYFATLETGEKALTPPDPNAKFYHLRRWNGHLNYSNPKILDQFIEDLHTWYDKSDPELIKLWKKCVNRVGLPNDLIIPVCPNDGIVIDQSEESKKLLSINQDRNLWGKSSDLIHTFYKKLAERVKEEFPKKRLFLAAYSQYSAPPETLKYLPDNCYISLCTMQPIANMKDPKIYNEWLGYAKQWYELTGNKIAVRHYGCWPRIVAPFPWAGIYQRWLKDTRDISSGSWICSTAMNQNAVHHLNYYFYSKLNWNPDYNLAAGLKEYTENMYGPAAKIMQTFFDLTRERWENYATDVKVEQWEPSSNELYGKDGIYPRKVVERLKDLLNQAVNAKGLSDVEKKRIEWVTQGHAAFFAEAAAIQSQSQPMFFAEKIKSVPAIDADSSDSVWLPVPELKVNRLIEDGKKAKIGAVAKVAWTDKSLFIIVDNYEPKTDEIRALCKDGGQLWLDDCVELWLDPEGSRSNCMQMIFNPAGKVFYRKICDGNSVPGWKPEGASVKTRIYPGEKWTLELELPFAGLDCVPERGMEWVWNLFRHRVPDVSQYMAVCPTMARRTQNLLAFPRLYFLENKKHLSQFDRPLKQKAKVSVWRQKGHENMALMDSVNIVNSKGVRSVTVKPEAVLPKSWQGRGTVLTVCAFAQKMNALKVTADTRLQTRLKLEHVTGADVFVRLWYRKNGEGKVHFIQEQLFAGKTDGKWVGVAKNIMTLTSADNKRKNKSDIIEVGDTVDRIKLYFKFPATSVFSGQIDYILID